MRSLNTIPKAPAFVGITIKVDAKLNFTSQSVFISSIVPALLFNKCNSSSYASKFLDRSWQDDFRC